MSPASLSAQGSTSAHGSITDVAGLRVGQVQRVGDGWLTGVSVVLPPPGTVGGVDVRGGGPGTHETDALDPRTLVPTVDAVVLTGGSAFGLVSAHGVQRWCLEHGRGFPVSDRPGEVVPIVPAAAIFDLGRGGVFGHHPNEQMGYDAAVAAAAQPEHGPVDRGTVGAGTGAAIAGQQFKGGVGTASVRLAGGIVVGALAVVNAAGAPLGSGPVEAVGWATAGTATTLVVVATDAALDPAETSRTATAAHDGLARALDPVHTMADGDTVFALATGRHELPSDRPARVAALVTLQAAAASVVRAAVVDGIARATPVSTPHGELPAWPGAAR